LKITRCDLRKKKLLVEAPGYYATIRRSSPARANAGV